MNATDKSFSQAETAILKQAKGKLLKSVDAVIVARGDLSWNTVRLHFDDMHVDISNQLGEIVMDEFGTLEEFGLLSVRLADGGLLDIPEASAETSKIEINEVAQAVEIIDNVINVYGNGNRVATVAYPQAIIIRLASGYLVLDKENWFSEMIAVKAETEANALVYDESINWEDDLEGDPDTHYEFKAVKVEL